jgi:3-methyladenine DNA glycosylase AlkD
MAGVSRLVRQTAVRVRRELEAQGRPAGAFDASRYFRTTEHLEFLNVRSAAVRALARQVAQEHRETWTVDDAIAFADLMIRDPHLEVKGLAIELLARYRRDFPASLFATCKRWLARSDAANWATTDLLCGAVLGPLLGAHRQLVARLATWSRHRNLWVRRASAVALIPLVRRGEALDDGYAVASRLRGDQADLIQKAAGWLLREAGKTDPGRLERYLRAGGPSIPRTTLRYAIERFPPDARAGLLAATRGVATGRTGRAANT